MRIFALAFLSDRNPDKKKIDVDCMHLSIIIPTYNEENNLGKCINAVRNCNSDDYEIIVVDGKSTDKTADVAKEYADKVIIEKNKKGLAAARNLGARISKAENIAFLDADSVPCKSWIDIVKKNMQDNIMAIGGPVSYGKRNYDIYSKAVFTSNRIISKFFDFFFLSGNNSAYNRKFFLKLGGFSNVVCEDVELAKKIGKYKKNLMFIPEMTVRLSSRRFEENGFLNTLLCWGTADFLILLNKGLSFEKYKKIQ